MTEIPHEQMKEDRLLKRTDKTQNWLNQSDKKRQKRLIRKRNKKNAIRRRVYGK